MCRARVCVCACLGVQPGVVNGIAFSPSGKFMVMATGQEHRLGRWWRSKPGRNGLAVVQLPLDVPKSKALV